jgi:hypothetical protein
MTRCLYSRLSLFFFATAFLIGCGNSKLREPKSIPAGDPAHVVNELLTSMAAGKIDDSKIIYSKDVVVLPVIQHPSMSFHDVKINIEDIKLSPYDPNTQTVEYSCVVPHPGVAFWQWKPVDASQLQNVPEGISMQGRFTMVQDKDAGWRVKVDDEKNPIVLYKRVVSSANQTWFSFMQSGMQGNRASGEAIAFHLIRLIVDYSICLGIPDREQTEFGKRMVEEAMKITPR